MALTLALDALTALELPPIELVDAAARNGCRTVSLIVQGSRLFPSTPDYGLINDKFLRRGLLQKLRDLDVGVDTVEVFVIDRHCDPESFRPAFETGVFLGATAVNTLAIDRNEKRLADTYGKFCSLAREYGLSVYTEIHRTLMHDSITKAVQFAKAFNLDFRIELDSLHFFRCGGEVEEIRRNHEWIGRAQLSDGPAHATASEYVVESLSRRQIPGDGVLPLVEFIRSLPNGIVAGVEVPYPDLRAEQRIARSVAACRDLVRRAFNASE
jgi:sugar phosphate isomerase/epimerase